MNHSMMDHSMMNHSHHMPHDHMAAPTHAGHDMNMHGSEHGGHHMHENMDMDMDMNMHHGREGAEMQHMMMSMVFHGGCQETILWSWWHTESVGALIGSMVVIFLVAAAYEALKYYRENLFWRTHNSLQYRAVAVPQDGKGGGGRRGADRGSPQEQEQEGRRTGEDGRIVHMVGEVIHKQPQHMLSWMNALQTFLHAVQVTVSFLLMLIFMTYNYWLCFAVVAGASTGYFLFGWKKSVIVDVTEHCH